MRLSNIKLAGFKSFVDATNIAFPSNLVGVVGPNGCGKSNVIDAVRWVMGESSASRLRGDSMTDVIFNGSSARKPVGTASIELVFDNSDGTVGGQYAKFGEISIKRTVARDGLSTYFLNGTKCRRKDITGIFLGTGLGPRSYSIIEQGMISRLIEAKPEEMRVYIEEAAGISKYKERRRETENRIRHTRENLERLTDILEEVEKQIKHLDRQAKAAEKYKVLKADERRGAAELLSLRLAELDARKEQHERAMADCETALQAAIARQRRVEANIEASRERHAERNEAFNEVQARYYKIGAEIARLEQAIEHARELRQRQEDDLRQAAEGAAEILAHIADDQSTLQQLEMSLSELAPGLEAARERSTKSDASLKASETAMAEWRERWDEFNHEAAESQRTLQVEQARIEQFDDQLQRIAAQRGRLAADFDAESLERISSELAQLTGSLEGHQSQADEARQQVEQNRQRLESARESESAALDGLRKAEQAHQQVAGEHAAAKALQQAVLGEDNDKLTGWLASNSLSSAPRLAAQLQVEAGWEAAVEMVAGSELQSLMVADLESVAAQSESLESGAVGFLQRSQPLPAAAGSSLAAKVGQVPAAMQARLARIRTAETLRDALSIRTALGDEESVITRDGEWVGRDFLLIHHRQPDEDSVLKREQRLRALSSQLSEARSASVAAEQLVVSARSDREELEQSLDRAQNLAAERHEALSAIAASCESLKLQQRQAEEQRAVFQRESDAMAEQENSGKTAIASAQQHIATARQAISGMDERRSALENQRATLAQELERVREQAEQDREAAQDIALRYESRKSTKDSASQNLARMQSQLSQFQSRESALKSQLAQAEQPAGERQTQLEANLEQRVAVEEDLGAARRALENSESELRTLEQERVDSEQAVQEQRESADKVRMAAQEVRVRQEGLLEQFDSENFDRHELIKALEEGATIELWEERLAKLTRRIDRLGPINLAAIDEFKEQSERKEYLDAQLEDLEKALQTLENAIRKIDRETRTRFKDTYDNINAGFRRLFPKLFGGGQAYLELTGDDLLTSGVTVMAQPPGKRNSTIHLLSGGEKALTAVALVFAIFELNPAPFCMLDEVDAPLDDANVNRFCEIVKEMAETVQFVFITHNKVTMEMARQLSGVTMNEPGVSRLVTVDLDEAVKMAAS